MSTKQITFNKNGSTIIRMSVKPAPLFIRSVFVVVLLIAIVAPLFGLALATQSKDGIKFWNVLLVFFFGLITFYFLRILLWNSFGSETITIFDGKVEYEADYKWFKDAKQTLSLGKTEFTLSESEDKKYGRLFMKDQEHEVQCAVKVEIDELRELIEVLRNECSAR